MGEFGLGGKAKFVIAYITRKLSALCKLHGVMMGSLKSGVDQQQCRTTEQRTHDRSTLALSSLVSSLNTDQHSAALQVRHPSLT